MIVYVSDDNHRILYVQTLSKTIHFFLSPKNQKLSMGDPKSSRNPLKKKQNLLKYFEGDPKFVSKFFEKVKILLKYFEGDPKFVSKLFAKTAKLPW